MNETQEQFLPQASPSISSLKLFEKLFDSYKKIVATPSRNTARRYARIFVSELKMMDLELSWTNFDITNKIELYKLKKNNCEWTLSFTP